MSFGSQNASRVNILSRLSAMQTFFQFNPQLAFTCQWSGRTPHG